MYIDPLTSLGVSGGPDLQGYLNRSDTRVALHAETSPNLIYHVELSNNGYPQYALEYAACNDRATAQGDGSNATMPSMIDVFQRLLGRVGTIVISSGDVDPVSRAGGSTRSCVLPASLLLLLLLLMLMLLMR
jgi:hypothetical protein